MTNQYNLDSNNYFGKMSQGLMPTFPVNTAMQQFASEMRRIPNKTLIQDQFMLQNQQPQKKKGKLGKKVAYIIGALGILTIALNKGASGKVSKALSNWAHNIEMSRLADIAKNGGELSAMDKAASKVGKFVRRISNFGKSAANFTAAKDTVATEITTWNLFGFFEKHNKQGVQKWLKKYIPLQRVFGWFEKHIFGITENAVKTKFMKANQAFDEMLTIFKKHNISSEQIEEITKLNKELLSDASRTGRWGEALKKLEGIGDRVKVLLGERKLGNYATEEAAAEARKVIDDAINNILPKITNNISDVSGSARTLARELLGHVKPEDINSRKLLGELEEAIGKFEAANSTGRITEETNITRILDNLKTHISGGDNTHYTDKTPLINLISNIQNRFTLGNPAHEKAILENIISTSGISKEAKEELKRAAERYRSCLFSATNAEKDALLRKAEVNVGAITTDVLSIGATAAVGGLAIANGEDKDEKIGASLKVALPLLGTIGAYFYTTAKGMSGFKNLAIALVSGWLLNKFGSAVNDGYQKSVKEKRSLMQMAQSAYNNATAV